MLLPFFPRNPHRFAIPKSWAPSVPMLVVDPLLPGRRRGLGGPSWIGFGLPPRIEETDEPAHRACLRIAEVTVMHSDMTKGTGSTATATGRLRYSVLRAGPLWFIVVVGDVLWRWVRPELLDSGASSGSMVEVFCSFWLIIAYEGDSCVIDDGPEGWLGVAQCDRR